MSIDTAATTSRLQTLSSDSVPLNVTESRLQLISAPIAKLGMTNSRLDLLISKPAPLMLTSQRLQVLIGKNLNVSPSVNTLDARLNPMMMKAGSISSFRWRGLRQSLPLVQIIESFIADMMSLKRRIILSLPFGSKPSLLFNNTGAGIYGTNDQDPRYNEFTDGILHLQPVVSQLNIIQLQYLRQQLAFRLSTLK